MAYWDFPPYIKLFFSNKEQIFIVSALILNAFSYLCN